MSTAGPGDASMASCHVAVQCLRRRRFPWPGRRARSWAGPAPGKPILAASRAGLRPSWAMPLAGCFRPSRRQDSLKLLAVFGDFDAVDAGADDRHAGVRKRPGQVQRRLAAELHDHAVRLHPVADVQHVFGRQRLEEQMVAGVVVGADTVSGLELTMMVSKPVSRRAKRPGSSSSRTRSPGRCGSARRRES